MEQNYRLCRKRASAANARGARTPELRLVHLDLAGRYSLKAAAASQTGEDPAADPRSRPAISFSMPEADYEQLETGARWLASRALDEAERHEHLGWANRYARLRLEDAAARKR
jgi:hypothetical protein